MESRSKRIPQGVHILGTGGFLPAEPISNESLIKEYNLDSTPQWIEEHIGIQSRHFATDGIATSDLAAEAARRALQDAGLSAADLDHILLCTTTGDWTSPASANRVQHLIGASCPAEDKQSACASFLFGLDHGIRLAATGASYVLVIGADIKSRFVRPTDRRLFPIFADGAGAVILRNGVESGGILACELWSDGARAQNLYTPAGGSALPASAETVSQGLHAVHMTVDGHTIFADAVEAMSRLSRKACDVAGVNIEEIDCFIPHQANLKIMRTVAAELGIPLQKVMVTIQYTGNTTSGTIPFALDAARREGRICAGSLVLLAAAGAGYSGGAALLRM